MRIKNKLATNTGPANNLRFFFNSALLTLSLLFDFPFVISFLSFRHYQARHTQSFQPLPPCRPRQHPQTTDRNNISTRTTQRTSKRPTTTSSMNTLHPTPPMRDIKPLQSALHHTHTAVETQSHSRKPFQNIQTTPTTPQISSTRQ